MGTPEATEDKVSAALNHLAIGLSGLLGVLRKVQCDRTGKENPEQTAFLDSTIIGTTLPMITRCRNAWHASCSPYSSNKEACKRTFRDLLQIPVRDWTWRNIGPSGAIAMVEFLLGKGLQPIDIPKRFIDRIEFRKKLAEKKD